MTEYQKKLEAFRSHYKSEYDINFDDEILYFFIRVNEMQKDIKKDIRNLPKVTFRTGWDYFLYGLGKWLVPSFLLLFSILVFRYFQGEKTTQNFKINYRNNQPFLELKSDTSTYLLQLQKK